jgi:hypothetical protein
MLFAKSEAGGGRREALTRAEAFKASHKPDHDRDC